MIQLIYPILSFTLIMVNEKIGMDGNVFELCMDISLVTWCHVQVENANDSDMSAPTMSSLALLSCTRHLRCCTQVPPPNGTADVTYQAGLTGAWGRPG